MVNSNFRYMPSQKNSSNGAFQRMGIDDALLKAIFAMNYHLPTPIQRKIIPVIKEGRDVVAMARTGSGKTAAFLIPILNTLSRNSTSVSYKSKPQPGYQRISAVIISPSRDLALQTCRFARSLARHLSLDICSISGGESLSKHFDIFTKTNHQPIIVTATLGRLVHVLVEMNISCLAYCKYLVLDEADRLFEDITFREQLSALINHLPPSSVGGRQNILLSATMPALVTDFIRSGLLHQPILCRLDSELNLNPNLWITYFYCPHDEKIYSLCSLVTSLPHLGQILIFVATRYDAELLAEVLKNVCKVKASAIFGNSKMDDEARQRAIVSFRRKKTKIIVTTDVAARGIDIPALDTIINYNFPRTVKLFVHRSGRAARGIQRKGTVISIVSNDEMPFLFDLHNYLNKKFIVNASFDEENFILSRLYVTDEILRESIDHVLSETLSTELQQSKNAWKAYLRNVKVPSSASIAKWKSCKEELISEMKIHPIFNKVSSAQQNQPTQQKHEFLTQLRNWRGQRTIFEINPSTEKSKILNTMKTKRTQLSTPMSSNMSSGEVENSFKDKNHYISYTNSSSNLNNLKIDTFTSDLQKCVMDLDYCVGEDDGKDNKMQNQCSKLNKMVRHQRLVWDKQQKKFISGHSIADKMASKKSWMYSSTSGKRGKANGEKYKEWLKKQHDYGGGNKGRHNGIKDAAEIVNRREKRAKKINIEKQRHSRNISRKTAKKTSN
ncbi:hypothetical protein GJ496_008302 [Pomphorhynchus laevis]|nr:hypothetical protein GJ496_008302 [Pomphorhynchus laevis]